MNQKVFSWFAVIVAAGVVLTAVFIFKPCRPVSGKRISAAVVAGFIQPFNEIASEFGKKTGIKIETTFSSAGKMYGQAINGAPYDIILADEERAGLLWEEGFAEKPFVYAAGEVVLWSEKNFFCASADWRTALNRKDIIKIAIANPETAVYGAAAKKALQSCGMWESLKPHLVTTLDLAQVFQYATTGAVDAGFCNLFQAYTEQGRKGCYYLIKEAPVVIHSACILKRSENRAAARLFAGFLVSADAERIKRRYGYK